MISVDFKKEALEKLSGKWGKGVLITLVYVLITVILSFISEKINNEAVSLIISIIDLFIGIPLAYGLINSFIKIFDNEDVSTFDFISSGFSNFSRSWSVAIFTFLKLLLPIVLMTISIILIMGGFFGSIMPLLQSSTDINHALSIINSSSIDPSSINASALLISLAGFVLYIISIILSITWSYYYKIAYIIAVDEPNLTSKEVVNKSKENMKGNRFKLFCLEFSFIGWVILAVCTFGIGFLWLIPYIQVAEISFARFVCGKKEEKPIETTENN